MQNHTTPDTPFAEVLHAVQAGEKRITWQKSHPISDSERANAKTTKWAFLAAAFALPIFSLSSCYFTPDICSPSSGLFFWLFLAIALVFNIGFIGFDIWIAKRMGRIADHPAAQPFPTLSTNTSSTPLRQRHHRRSRQNYPAGLAKIYPRPMGRNPPHRQRRRNTPPQPNHYPTPKRQISR